MRKGIQSDVIRVLRTVRSVVKTSVWIPCIVIGRSVVRIAGGARGIAVHDHCSTRELVNLNPNLRAYTCVLKISWVFP